MLKIKLGTDIIVGGAVVLKDQQSFAPQCAIDGMPVLLASASNHSGVLCEEYNLSNGTHTIVIINVNESNSTSQLWVDFIQYTPSSSIPPDGGNIFIPVDISMTFGPDWAPIKNDTTLPGIQTNVNGAGIDINSTGTPRDYHINYFVMKKDFIGSSITWFGCPSDTLSQLPPANVVYTIDGVPAQGTANNTLILFDANLEYGTHQIHVNYGGSSNEMPLSFCGFAVASTHNASPLGNISSPSVAHATPIHVRSTTEVALILGATAAGAALLFLLSIITQLYIQQRRRRLIKLHSEECGRA